MTRIRIRIRARTSHMQLLDHVHVRSYLLFIILLFVLHTTDSRNTVESTSSAAFQQPRAHATTTRSSTVSEFQPKADPAAIVQLGNARFTVLTSHLIRMEYSAQQTFQDAATFAFIRRLLPVPKFTTSQDGDTVHIRTSNVELNYTNDNNTFSASNLVVSVLVTVGNNSSWVQWSPMPAINDQTNPLPGTIRTLDGNTGYSNLDCRSDSGVDRHCTAGIISRQGYSVVDDTHSLYYDDGAGVDADADSTISASASASASASWPWIVPRVYTGKSGAVCNVSGDSRRDCGYMGISKQQCYDRGCCYSDSMTRASAGAGAGVGTGAGVPSCFYSLDADQDLYMFGYGLDYKLALYEFTLVAGSIPMPPRFAFGIFFSRYWAYNDIGERSVVNEYVSHDVPLDVLVTDMDWHLTFYKEANAGVKDQAGQPIGWGGFTWDSRLFPDPQAFLDWCKAHGLKNTLNVHPASGMQPWEDKYEVMARAMGIDPTTRTYVPFNITDSKFTNSFNQLVLQPHVSSGIDFWWLDWQQGETWLNLPYVNPTQWLNYVFFTNPLHWANAKRPLLLHRWGGLGNHRYQVGFSGDVVPSWESLANQPWFTASAANVGYGYWSHDLGGHVTASPPELYTRWIQWGTFSPIFRTHCTKNANNDRRIWTYPDPYYTIMRTFHKLRQALVPTIVTAARRTYETGVSIVHPLYYEYAALDVAYSYKHEYLFGDSMLVAPITTPIQMDTGMAVQSIWLPPSESFVGFFDGGVYTGPLEIKQSYRLEEMPLFVKAGHTIFLLPDNTPALGSSQLIPSHLRLVTFIGGLANNTTISASALYEDDGTTTHYQQHTQTQTQTQTQPNTDTQYAWTQVTTTVTGQEDDMLQQTIHPASCSSCFAGQRSARTYSVEFRGVFPATSCQVNGESINYQMLTTKLGVAPNTGCSSSSASAPASSPASSSSWWSYDGSSLSLVVRVGVPMPISSPVVISCQLLGPTSHPSLVTKNSFGFQGRANRFSQAKQALDQQWGTSHTVYQDDYPSLLLAATISDRLSSNPASAMLYLSQFEEYARQAVKEVQQLDCEPTLKTQLISQLT